MFWLILVITNLYAGADIKFAPVVRVDQKKGLSCMAADEEDLQLLMEQDAIVMPPVGDKRSVEDNLTVDAKRPQIHQMDSTVMPHPAPSPMKPMKKKPRILRMKDSDRKEMPPRLQPKTDEDDSALPPPPARMPVRALRSPDVWLTLKAKEQQMVQDISELHTEGGEFLRLAKDVMRVRKALAEEKRKMLSSGWLEEDLPFPEALDVQDEDIVTISELDEQERVILARMRDSVMGGETSSHERIKRQRKALKEIKAQKALLHLNDVRHKKSVSVPKTEEQPVCSQPDIVQADALETPPVYNDGSAAAHGFDDMDEDVITAISQDASPGLWQGAVPSLKGGRRVEASLEQQWRYWT